MSWSSYKLRRLLYRHFRVILGGGKKQFGIPVDPGKDDSCNRNDSRNLLDTWMSGKKGCLFVNNTAGLMNADSSKVRNISALLDTWKPARRNYWSINNNADSSKVKTVSPTRDKYEMCLYENIRPVLMENNTEF